MTTVKQICLGVAVAGVVAGAGSALATGVAYAETNTAETNSAETASASDSTPSSGDDATSRKEARKAEKAKRQAADTEDSDTEDSDTTETNTTDTEPDDESNADTSKDTDTSKDADTSKDTDTDTDTAATQADTEAPSPRRFGAHRDDADEDTAAQDTAEPEVLSSLKPVRAPQIPFIPAPLIPATPASATSVTVTTSSTNRSRTSTTADVAAQAVDPTKARVLVIGIDGTNLTRVLDNPNNTNFFDFMDTGTTGPTTIVGHTTISNPSWTAILTGVWDNKSGVINNVFTPQTYNTWPTVFNQLEAANPAIETKVIADWQVIADIAGAGSHRADEIVFVPRGENDPLYAQADAEVTAETVRSILGTDEDGDVPNFLFTYVTQVDEAGHQFGGASPEYAEAIARTNTNVGQILAAVAEREATTCAAGPSSCEDWTVIMVTDHGHQPQQGFGHGFQSPDETASFVIVDGPGYGDGEMNLKYSIVDITPTVVSMFGIEPTVDADGVPLPDHAGSQVDPADLHQAIHDTFDRYGWPDIQTNVALSLRTIFAFIPYYVDNITTEATAQLQSIANQGIFLVSDLAALAIFPVELVGDAVYALTDVIAQLVGRLTGAGTIPPSTSTERDGRPYLYPVWV